jgi:tetratricopeptide (TPR) repeat protein
MEVSTFFKFIGLIITVVTIVNWRRLHNHIKFCVLTPYDGDRFVIAVAALTGDKTGSQREHILDGLEKFFKSLDNDNPVEILDFGIPLKIPEVGLSQERIDKATLKGQKWLSDKNADVLIFGKVSDTNNAFKLRFLVRDTQRDLTHQSFQLDEKLELKADFNEQALAALIAKIITSLSPFYQGGKYIVLIARPLAQKIEGLLRVLTTEGNTEQTTDLSAKLADLHYLIGTQSGTKARFEKAIALYRQTLTEWTQDKVPLQWAMTQNNLGNALSALGERGDNDALKKAITAYEQALTEWTQAKVPLPMATTQNNLGNALLELGERGDNHALKKAISVYKQALIFLIQDKEPLQWASIQNNLGNALLIAGRCDDEQALEQAITAFEQALTERTQDKVPLQWAMTQNNLGNALSALGERGDDDALKQAITAYESALTEWTQDKVPLDWAMTQNNLGIALSILGQHSDEQALEQAISAYELALTERTHDKVPLDWATTQNNLGIALLTLGERGDEHALKKAITACEQALIVFTENNHESRLTVAHNNLKRAQNLLKNLQKPKTD